MTSLNEHGIPECVCGITELKCDPKRVKETYKGGEEEDDKPLSSPLPAAKTEVPEKEKAKDDYFDTTKLKEMFETEKPKTESEEQCEVMETVFSKQLPFRLQVDYFQPHRLGAQYHILPLLQKEITEQKIMDEMRLRGNPRYEEKWTHFLQNLPNSEYTSLPLPSKKHYHFYQQQMQYFDTTEYDLKSLRKSMKDGGIDENGRQFPTSVKKIMKDDKQIAKQKAKGKKDEKDTKAIAEVTKPGFKPPCMCRR